MLDDLAPADNRRVARNAKAKMHALVGDRHRGKVLLSWRSRPR